MNEQLEVGYRANRDITAYLECWSHTLEVVNVEEDKDFQKKDIDNVWRFMQDGKEVTMYIEVKGDRKHETGNYFFETVSNLSKNTPGCFMYSEADYFFYYFVDIQQLHVIPLIPARKWFVAHQNEFRERTTNTHNSQGRYLYSTKGSLVSTKRMIREVEGVKVIEIGKYLMEKVA